MAAFANKVKVNLDWIESEVFENEDPAPFLEHVNGILVPAASASAAPKARSAGAVRPCPRRTVFRHLLRHADGGHRSRAQSRRHRGSQLHRVRSDKEPLVGLMTEWLRGQ